MPRLDTRFLPMHEPGIRKTFKPGQWPMRVATGLALMVTAIIYWPVVHANFVWDDLVDFRDNAWLTHGHAWMHYVLRDFNHWTNYFRPLIVAFFTLQVRLFDVTPGPMHAVNLGMHLINMALVGLLARHACRAAGRDDRQITLMASLCMLLYGLHPVLIEPVVWIGCQFDLAATLFMLLGLLANISIKAPLTRAAVVALMFLLAAGCKESAASFPLILAVTDWAILAKPRETGLRQALATFASRNWRTFAAMLVAGLGYLVVRYWALGHLIGQYANGPSSRFGRLQEACFIYLQYWRMLFLPMSGMGPVHPVDVHRFDPISLYSLLTDTVALSLVAVGLYFAVKRASAFGCIVVAMTAALIPVLHITSVAFDSSLYHERYVMTGLAVACGMLPLIQWPPLDHHLQRPLGWAIGAICATWFLFATIAIRTTIPLWSNSINLWRWALIVSPKSLDADNNLLSAYIMSKDYDAAQRLVDKLQSQHVQCTPCMLNAAILANAINEPDRALIALEQVRNSREILVDKPLFSQYLLVTGQALVLQGHLPDAENLFHAATRLNPLNPQPWQGLSVARALQGQAGQARQALSSALPLLPPNKRNDARDNIEKIIQMNRQHASPHAARP